MEWAKFFWIVGVCYALYYVIIIISDLLRVNSASRKVAANQTVTYEVVETREVSGMNDTAPEAISTDDEKKKFSSREMNSEETCFVRQELGLITEIDEDSGLEVNEMNLLGYIKADNQFKLLHV